MGMDRDEAAAMVRSQHQNTWIDTRGRLYKYFEISYAYGNYTEFRAGEGGLEPDTIRHPPGRGTGFVLAV